MDVSVRFAQAGRDLRAEMEAALDDFTRAAKFIYGGGLPELSHSAPLAGLMFLILGALASVGGGPRCGTFFGLFLGMLVLGLEYDQSSRKGNLFSIVLREKLPLFSTLSGSSYARGSLYSLFGILFVGLGGLSAIPALLLLAQGLHLVLQYFATDATLAV